MSLLDVLRSGIKTADKVTKPLQSTVTFKRGTTNNGYGIDEATGVPLRAIVDWKSGQVRVDGVVRDYSVEITLLDISALVTATSGLGVQSNDVFILQDGSTQPIVSTGGFVDAGTGHPIATTVRLG